MTTGRKLAIGVFVIVGVTAYMAYLGASTGWQYYLTVDECVADARALAEDRIRVGGTVAHQSLRITGDGRHAAFSLQGQRHRLPVVCTGPLPDRLSEGIDVLVEGRLDASGCLRGEKIIARCASKYESRPARATAQRAARAGKDGPE
ncbi:MAG: cytochrome c maturation protein CcmE [Planctomycetes bacterium]|nr:cytochrome c maturation protein CcmE [Planctomycetota bacterium]